MRREKRPFSRDNMDVKKALYIAGGVLALTVIAFVAIFILYGTGNQEQTQLARFNSTILEEDNSDTTEEASSQMGRTVNEMASVAANEIAENVSNANSVNSNTTKDTSSENNKYAVNTSKTEKNSTETSKNSETAKKDNAQETNKEEEKPVKDPEFKMPVEGEIIREFAKDSLVYSATLDEWVTHDGIDIKAEKATVVKASADGTVKSIKNDPRYGLTVVIEHVNGFTTVYSNLLTAEFIEEGEKVEQGQTIATVGNTATFEIADESHLHFEIRKDNVSIDPELKCGN